MPGPMHGMRIVDCTIALTGPWAVGILADQGADVIKLEPRGLGDIARWVGVSIARVSAMAQMAIRGKRLLAVTLHADEGRDIARCLVEKADAARMVPN